jgi:hypothetical protein
VIQRRLTGDGMGFSCKARTYQYIREGTSDFFAVLNLNPEIK